MYIAAMLNIEFPHPGPPQHICYLLFHIVSASVDFQVICWEMLNSNLTMLPLLNHCSPCHVCLWHCVIIEAWLQKIEKGWKWCIIIIKYLSWQSIFPRSRQLSTCRWHSGQHCNLWNISTNSDIHAAANAMKFPALCGTRISSWTWCTKTDWDPL